MICITEHVAHFAGTLKAYASVSNPLQTVLELVISPFGANKNRQRIPRSEAENIVRTCLYQPIKIDLGEHNVLGGHKNSIPVGTITSANIQEDAITGMGVIWLEEFPEVGAYLKKRTAENNPPSTSWEILYGRSTLADDGIEDLYETYYAANTIVANPSYDTKTLLRCVAEDLGLKETMTEKDKEVAESLDQERVDISALQDQLLTMFEALDRLYFFTFEIEAAEAAKTENVEAFTARFSELVAKLSERANTAGVALAETHQTLETLQTEVLVLRAEKAEAATAAKRVQRESELTNTGLSFDSGYVEQLMILDDTTFAVVVSGFTQIKNKSVAEIKPRIELPEILTPAAITTETLIEAHRELQNKKGA